MGRGTRSGWTPQLRAPIPACRVRSRLGKGISGPAENEDRTVVPEWIDLRSDVDRQFADPGADVSTQRKSATSATCEGGGDAALEHASTRHPCDGNCEYDGPLGYPGPGPHLASPHT
jgi:hypothetical protein